MNNKKNQNIRTPRDAARREDFVPLHRRLFPIEQRAIARAAVAEVLG